MSVYTMITDGLHYKKGAYFIRLRGIKLTDEKGQKEYRHNPFTYNKSCGDYQNYQMLDTINASSPVHQTYQDIMI